MKKESRNRHQCVDCCGWFDRTDLERHRKNGCPVKKRETKKQQKEEERRRKHRETDKKYQANKRNVEKKKVADAKLLAVRI